MSFCYILVNNFWTRHTIFHAHVKIHCMQLLLVRSLRKFIACNVISTSTKCLSLTLFKHVRRLSFRLLVHVQKQRQRRSGAPWRQGSSVEARQRKGRLGAACLSFRGAGGIDRWWCNGQNWHWWQGGGCDRVREGEALRGRVWWIKVDYALFIVKNND